MRYSKNSKVRFVSRTHDGKTLRAIEALSSDNSSLTLSRAGLSELTVEQNAKRRFGESNDDFAERMLETRSYVRHVTERNESSSF